MLSDMADIITLRQHHIAGKSAKVVRYIRQEGIFYDIY